MTFLLYALLVGLGFTFFLGILNALPVATELSPEIASAITLVYGYMNLFNFWFPVDTLFQVLVATLVFEAAIFAWKIIRWVLSLVRGARL